MKLKYYLRGLGIGIIITTLVLMIAGVGHKTELTDEEIIKRAEALGMVMEEDPLFSNSEKNNDTEKIEETEKLEESEQSELVTEDERETSTENVQGTDTESENPSETESEIETETESEDRSDTEVSAETEKDSEVEATDETYHLVINPGAIPRLICNELEENGVIESAAALRQYLADIGFITSISVGEYDIPYGVTNEEVYQILKAGPNR